MSPTTRVQGPTIEQMQSGPFVPGRNTDPAALAVKNAHIRDRHVAPLNDLADRVADVEGIARGLVPYIDPQLGGVEATVLALLDNPSTKAEAGSGSGLLSLENDDHTARFCATKYNDYGLTPDEVVHWNVAPAPIAGPKNGQSSAAERDRGARWLHELLELLPNLQVILLMGGKARDGWRRSGLAPANLLIPPRSASPVQARDEQSRRTPPTTSGFGRNNDRPPRPSPGLSARTASKQRKATATDHADDPAISEACRADTWLPGDVLHRPHPVRWAAVGLVANPRALLQSRIEPVGHLAQPGAPRGRHRRRSRVRQQNAPHRPIRRGRMGARAQAREGSDLRAEARPGRQVRPSPSRRITGHARPHPSGHGTDPPNHRPGQVTRHAPGRRLHPTAELDGTRNAHIRQLQQCPQVGHEPIPCVLDPTTQRVRTATADPATQRGL